MITNEAPLPRGTEWQSARTACRTAIERSQLREAHEEGWTALEFNEYARSCHRRANRDDATPQSYRDALVQLYKSDPLLWRALFRERGSQPLPPRSSEELKYNPSRLGIGSDHRYWPFHSPELIATIDARARAHFKIPEGTSLHPHTWTASYRHYQKEQAEAGKVSAPVPEKPKRPKASKPDPRKLAPQFNRSWPGHSPEFIAEVDARVIEYLRSKGYSEDLRVSDTMWKRIAHRDYELT